jgi:diguanylate cyclase (GGDEF)-like protein
MRPALPSIRRAARAVGALLALCALVATGQPGWAAPSAELSWTVAAADDPDGACRPDRPAETTLAFVPVTSAAAHRRHGEGPLWLRTMLSNPTSAAQRRVVAVWFPYLDEVMLLLRDARGGIVEARHGASIARPADALPSPVPAFAVDVPPHGTAEVLLCIRSSTIIIAPLRIFNEPQFWSAAMVDAALVAAMLGLIAAALLYALVCAATLRQSVFLAFVGFAAAALLYVALATGYAKLWFWPEHGWETMRLYGVAQAGLLASGVLFLRILLRPAETQPNIDRVMVGLIAIGALTAGAMALPTPISMLAYAVAAGIGPLAILFAVLLLWRRGVRHAGAAAVGWGPGLLATLHLYLRVHDVTPYHPWNHLLGPAAVTFACVCFAWVLAASIRSAEERALIDPLTGLWNRRWLEMHGRAALARSRRRASPLSIGVFDADFFKQINDRWGHAVGDVVLQHLAAEAAAHLRQGDYIARIGGEEFCIVFADQTADEAAAALERIRAAIEANPVGPLPAGAVTISGGVAMNRGGTVPLETLLHAADTALYRAKEAGRNRIEIAPEVGRMAPLPTSEEPDRRAQGERAPLLVSQG